MLMALRPEASSLCGWGPQPQPPSPRLSARPLWAIPLHEGDFTSFDLGKTFDAVTCMFSSIGYARTADRLDTAIAVLARHLAPGGVLAVEPWFRKSTIQPGAVRGILVEEEGIVVARTSRWVTVGDDESDLEFSLLVTTPDGSESFTERHVMGLYEPDRYVEAAVKAGLEAEFLTEGSPLGRGMLVGVRR